MTDFDSLKKSFKDSELIKQALTHRSWVNEHPGERDTNERLEFLGDAVLEFIVSKELYLKFPNKKEGFLTSLRANLVNTIGLSMVARELKIGQYLYLSKGEEESGGRNNSSLLADTMEAVIGAIFLDQGITKTEEFIRENILSKTQKLINQPLKDPKSRLQEAIQAKGMPAPRYVVIKESGPDHQKIFVVKVFANGKALARGTGKNKAEAEQEAAKKALEKII